MTGPKILTLDIETSPAVVYTFDLFRPIIPIGQIIEPTRVLCWAAKWNGSKGTQFGAEWQSPDFIGDLLALMEDADVVVTWNGNSFDIPHIKREALERGHGPLRPFKSLDLYREVRKHYRFMSNKLDFVSGRLLGQHKLSHSGFKLWKDVLAGDVKAQNLMERYNRRDVIITDRVLDHLKPYVNMPHAGLYVDPAEDAVDMCRCGSTDLERRGLARTDLGNYQQYRCRSCGRWPRGNKRVNGVTVR